jgi:hypothetical protein
MDIEDIGVGPGTSISSSRTRCNRDVTSEMCIRGSSLDRVHRRKGTKVIVLQSCVVNRDGKVLVRQVVIFHRVLSVKILWCGIGLL